jgi:hypothetical protein
MAVANPNASQWNFRCGARVPWTFVIINFLRYSPPIGNRRDSVVVASASDIAKKTMNLLEQVFIYLVPLEAMV